MAGYTRQQLIAAKAGVVGVTSFAAGWYLGREEGDYAASILVALAIFGTTATAYELLSSWLASWFGGGAELPADPHEAPGFRPSDPIKVLATFLIAQLAVWVGAVMVVGMPAKGPGATVEATAAVLRAFPIALPISMIVSALAVFLLARRLSRRVGTQASRVAFALQPPGLRALVMAAGAGALLATLLGLLSLFVPAPGIESQGLLARALTGNAASRIAFGLTAVLLAPPVEEYVFRGVLLGTLLPMVGTLTAAVLSGSAFWLLHASEWRHYWPAALGIAAMTLLVTLLRLRTGSILPGICAHIAYNAALTLMVLRA